MARKHQAGERDEATDRDRALAITPVSRETLARLDTFAELLSVWQPKLNLIAPSTVDQVWTRHIADSLQLLSLAPQARVWVDLGSGAGFPGLVLGCAMADLPGAQVHLVESNAKKAAFLRSAIRATGAAALVHDVRIEDFTDTFGAAAEVVTARALAPLAGLLSLAYPLLKKGARGLFLKGQDVGAELTSAAKYWNIEHTLVPSRTNPQGRVVVVHSLAPHPSAVDPNLRGTGFA